MINQTRKFDFSVRICLLICVVSFSESVASGPRIPVNEDVDVKNTIKSERIVLSSKIAADCPFFL